MRSLENLLTGIKLTSKGAPGGACRNRNYSKSECTPGEREEERHVHEIVREG
jgi:hypothetical protein